MSAGSNNTRIARNTLFLYLRMFFVLIVSLYTSRIVLNVLGVSDYGVYNVVAGFVLLFGFLNATLSSSMQRFYNYEGGRRGLSGYRDVYSTGFWIHLFLAVVIFIILESFGLWYINTVMVIDADRLVAANFLFQFSTFSMVFVILQVPYLSAIIANESMDYYATVSIVDVVLKLAIVFALPYIPQDKLIVYGTLSLVIAIVDFLMYYIYSKRKYQFVQLTTAINRQIFKELLSFSGWNLVGTFAFMLKGQGLNLLLNGFFNTIVNAARGVAFQVNGAISGFTNNIATAFRPQIVDSYAKGELERTKKLMFAESKFCYCLILVLILPVSLEIDYLLSLWLGDAVPPQTNVFSILVLIDLLLCTLNTPVTQIAFATGDIKNYQMFNSIVNLLLIPVCYVFLKMGYEAESVFVLTIIFTIINQIICLYLLHSLFEFSYLEYLKQIILPCFLISIVLPVLPMVIRINMNESFVRFLSIGFSDIVLALPLIYFIILNKSEKSFVIQYINKKICR